MEARADSMHEGSILEEGSVQGDEEGSMQGDDDEEGSMPEHEGLMLEEASSMRLGMTMPTSFTSAEAAVGEVDNIEMASILDLMSDGLAYTLNRKADLEQALLENLLGSLRQEQQKLEADAARLADSLSQP
ncbi:hypothetical protein M758_1G323600 [Ceratodon purpureus]|uniref:Uncharacterized protein n=1 Tax=Ceratodon purpureus TaxID=3225 RepID=A0A8T0JEC5_CERPU|nr:hypothetical protein KC19_N041900 [Ceratodon purpureus]KAG0593452.1 hypothetical protein KC19_1G330900 [Ceratodon purpureus]KAG0632381.1 hypothetical protein M758_1G323600 [Ceratodon purpureus]